MEKWINMVENFCTDPSRENEFNNFYNNVHVPDVLSSPGYLAAKRYIIKEPRNGRGTYLAIYEIETDDMDKTMTTRLQRREQERQQGRKLDQMVPNSFVPYWSDVQFKKIYEVSNK